MIWFMGKTLGVLCTPVLGAKLPNSGISLEASDKPKVYACAYNRHGPPSIHSWDGFFGKVWGVGNVCFGTAPQDSGVGRKFTALYSRATKSTHAL